MDELFLAAAAEILESFSGFRSPEANRAHFRRTILKQAAASGLAPERYVATLAGDESALRLLVNAATIGETYFFREASQFKALRDHVLPRLAKPDRILRCWSASCSTGEEAVSIAAVLSEIGASHGGFEVHASDINDEALERLRKGVFPRSSLRRDGEEFHASLGRHIVVRDQRTVTIDQSLLSTISVRRLNLFKDPLDNIPEGLDVVFLRNTLLYMPQERRETIVDRVAVKLREGGALFLSTGEIPLVRREGLRLEERDRVYFLVKEPAVRSSPRGSAKVDAAGATASSAGETAEAATGEAQPRPESAVPRSSSEASARAPIDAAIASYDEGRLRAAKGETEEAVAEFGRALEADPSFWPARFHRARLTAAGSARRARREFERCIADIDLMDAAARRRLGPVLDDFDSAYFRRMCERWIERLDDTGGRECR